MSIHFTGRLTSVLRKKKKSNILVFIFLIMRRARINISAAIISHYVVEK